MPTHIWLLLSKTFEIFSLTSSGFWFIDMNFCHIPVHQKSVPSSFHRCFTDQQFPLSFHWFQCCTRYYLDFGFSRVWSFPSFPAVPDASLACASWTQWAVVRWEADGGRWKLAGGPPACRWRTARPLPHWVLQEDMGNITGAHKWTLGVSFERWANRALIKSTAQAGKMAPFKFSQRETNQSNTGICWRPEWRT